MMRSLIIQQEMFDEIIEHLVPVPHDIEHSGFILASQQEGTGDLTADEWHPCEVDDYEFQSAYHIELKAALYSSIIKLAHENNYAIIELHSHLHQESVHFSPTDWAGLNELVPRVMWRLPDRPYVAIVVSTSGYDALLWNKKNTSPEALSAILCNGKQLIPTNISINSINHERG